jgi:coenzyme F420-reducing hydrogenase beta subunit
MLSFDFNLHCTGCSACVSICPEKAIEMLKNSEGFLMPYINNKLCSGCKLCQRVCPYINFSTWPAIDLLAKNAYFYFAPNGEDVKRSASGGVFYSLARRVLSEGGFVCGCVWSENLAARHIVSDEMDDVERMQGSKYVQSDLGSSFKEIRELLKNGKKVLFSGTPCQVAGIKSYVGEMSVGRLITLSIICHGVPSPDVWRKYVSELEVKYSSRLVSVNMRSKISGYHNPMCEYVFSNGCAIYKSSYLEDAYITGFLENIYLRNCCHDCKFKGGAEGADIICGDAHNGVFSPRGASVIIPLTKNGDDLLFSVLGTGLMRTDVRRIVGNNDMLGGSTPVSKLRSHFFKIFKQNSFGYAFFVCVRKKYYIKMILHKMRLFYFMRSLYLAIKGQN